ncbi:unnamed protein product [Notodromas monacha]|uniref:Pro-resilin n=1 Tax=Notodromas monacha TaxID=399045 RepID=A0A7R9BXH9_9CRUS|nr:unnamed protein product [Notodromas monacha]CAG0921937.1 unnamed protein product [Notodromas monacha]
MMKITILALAVCCAAVVSADSGEQKSSHRGYHSRPSPKVYHSKADSDSYENDAPKYQFAYQVKASAPVKKYGGSGSDSDEYGKRTETSHESAEFGHAETRDGDSTKGKYFVELPDGRLQTVEYYVNGDSGYVAKVSYSGGDSSSASAEKTYKKY